MLALTPAIELRALKVAGALPRPNIVRASVGLTPGQLSYGRASSVLRFEKGE
jgi:hypothetical protein